jgi:hypothetical protein
LYASIFWYRRAITMETAIRPPMTPITIPAVVDEEMEDVELEDDFGDAITRAGFRESMLEASPETVAPE